MSRGHLELWPRYVHRSKRKSGLRELESDQDGLVRRAAEEAARRLKGGLTSR